MPIGPGTSLLHDHVADRPTRGPRGHLVAWSSAPREVTPLIATDLFDIGADISVLDARALLKLVSSPEADR